MVSGDCKGCIGGIEKCLRTKSKPCQQCEAKGIDCLPMTEQEREEWVERRCQLCSAEHRICRPVVLGIPYPCRNCEARKGGKCVPRGYKSEKRKAVHENPTNNTKKMPLNMTLGSKKIRLTQTSTKPVAQRVPESKSHKNPKESAAKNYSKERDSSSSLSSFLSYNINPLSPDPEIAPSQPFLLGATITNGTSKIEDHFATSYKPATDVRFSGCEEDRVQRLSSSLYDALIEFEMMVKEALQRAQNTVNGSTGKLPDETSLANIRTIEQIMLQDNLPVGNALMKVLGVTWTDGNSVETQMRGVSLSLLHTSILSWLAFDIIEDKNAFNRQPCVFSMKIALEVQRDLADDRYPGQGLEALREFQLRVLHKREWKEALLESSYREFADRLLKFLEPITKIFRDVECPLQKQRDIVVKEVTELWSYLQSLRGKLELINPARGETFNFDEHDVFDDLGSRIEPWKAENKKVFLVRCPGLRWYRTTTSCEKPALILKARIIFDL